MYQLDVLQMFLSWQLSIIEHLLDQLFYQEWFMLGKVSDSMVILISLANWRWVSNNLIFSTGKKKCSWFYENKISTYIVWNLINSHKNCYLHRIQYWQFFWQHFFNSFVERKREKHCECWTKIRVSTISFYSHDVIWLS